MSDVTPTEGLIVGAQQKPDGSWDMSHAMRAIGEWKLSNPVVDRLRGPLQIDTRRESRYQTFQSTLKQEAEQGNLSSWFINTLNGLKEENSPAITPDDITSLRLVTDDPHLEFLRKQFGHDYSRPFFQLNLGDYYKVYEKLTGKIGSYGVTIQGGILEENEVTKGIPLIITPTMGPDIMHEIIHSIDPNIDKRSPSDEVLEEFGAYYQEIFQPRVYTSTTVSTDKYGNKSAPVTTSREVYKTIPGICRILKTELYTDKYASAFSSLERYNARIDEIGNVLKQLSELMSSQDIQKAILNAKSFHDLVQCANIIKQEKSLNSGQS